MADVCPSQGYNWLYPSPLTLNRQMADTGCDFCAVRKFGFFSLNEMSGHLIEEPLSSLNDESNHREINVGDEKTIYGVVLIALANAKANETNIYMKIVHLAFPYPTKLGIV